MPARCCSRLRRRGSALILFTFMSALLIPLIGLAIDQSMIWIVRAKLQTAVDGAALGAGRLLGTAADVKEIAGEYLKANFAVGKIWSTYNLVPDITFTRTLSTNTIVVSAKVDLPLLFGRIFGTDHVTVPATGTATRKDTRVVLVLDRSGSMLNTMTDLRSNAAQFTSMFTPGTDELGLVVYGTSAIVGYPQYASTRPYDYTISGTSVGGPDTSFADAGTSPLTGPMITAINSIVVGGNTGMPEALSLAYIELQKAHMIDAAKSGGVDDRLNSIVFMTDGVPNELAVYVNNPSENSLKTTSTCTNNPANASNPATKMIGSFGNNTNAGIRGTQRLLQLATTDTKDDSANNPVWTLFFVSHSGCVYQDNCWDRSQGENQFDMATLSNASPSPFDGCGSGTKLPNGLDDLARIPAHDLYGNSTDGTGYVNSTLSSVYNGTSYNHSQYSAKYHVTLAAWNAVDNVGQRIRTDANLASRAGDATNMNIAIYVIGYQGNGGTDDGLLKRLANTQDSTSYDKTQPSGIYVSADDPAGLAQAFQTVASELLRLAK